MFQEEVEGKPADATTAHGNSSGTSGLAEGVGCGGGVVGGGDDGVRGAGGAWRDTPVPSCWQMQVCVCVCMCWCFSYHCGFVCVCFVRLCVGYVALPTDPVTRRVTK